ncbi:MAG: branched-chain amino acid ABC transporter permease [Streptosporangiaceae bacterium]
MAVLANAGLLFLVASGLNLVFGILRVINVTHGSFYMYGAFLATTLAAVVGGSSSSLIALVLPAAICIGVLAGCVEVTVVRPLYSRDHLMQLLATYGAFLVLDDLALHIWGPQDRTVNFTGWLAGSLTVSGHQLPVSEIFTFGAAVVVAAGLWLVINHTLTGRTMRAMAEDRELVALMGVPVRRLYSLAFMASGALAGLAGGLVIAEGTIGPGIDVTILVETFVVAVIGGLGSIVGSGLGALLIATLQQLTVSFAPAAESYVLYGLMLLVLVIKPTGLLGKPEAA